MKCVTIIGTRPEFIQCSQVSRAIRERHTEILVNTGQHYDDAMSRVFVRELHATEPEINLAIAAGGAGHGAQTGPMLVALERLLIDEAPDWVVVYGDTNSTLAGALAAAKLNLRVVHIEAGLRSFDRTMPEEVNRVITDHVSHLLLAPTTAAVSNLSREGIVDGVVQVGDVRLDVLAAFVPLARPRRDALLRRCGLSPGLPFALATVHRASNTDDGARLAALFGALGALDVPVVLPVHPRLRKMLDAFGVAVGPNVRLIEPLGFLDLLAALEACSVVLTDSGGLQKEAYLLERPCVTLRNTTEWVETIEVGWNRLAEPEALPAAIATARAGTTLPHPNVYGDIGVSQAVVRALEAGLA
jgi:UDP-N-acetylglucosamine 2-epimerase